MIHKMYLLATAAGTLGLLLLASRGFLAKWLRTRPVNQQTAVPDETIRPFHVNFSDEALADLHRRILATRWPDQETVTDASQGVQLATMQKLAQYWATDYDWRKCEAKLNALPLIRDHISTGWRFNSSMSARKIQMRCRSSSRTDGPDRLSNN